MTRLEEGKCACDLLNLIMMIVLDKKSYLTNLGLPSDKNFSSSKVQTQLHFFINDWIGFYFLLSLRCDPKIDEIWRSKTFWLEEINEIKETKMSKQSEQRYSNK